MLIPIGIIIFIASLFVTIASATITFFWKSVTTLRNGFERVEKLLVELSTENRFGSKESSEKHNVIDSRLNEHSAKIQAHGLLLAEHEVKIKELLK